MAAFDRDTDPAEDRALRLLQLSPVTLFHRPAALAETTTWLAGRGYQVVTLPAGTWTDEADLHRDVARLLHFPAYYGRNLDALHDCLRDVVEQAYGWDSQATGLVVVLFGFDAFARLRPTSARVLLDLLAQHSREASLLGGRLLTLLQSDDPEVRFARVGGSDVAWNDPEWPAARRRGDA